MSVFFYGCVTLDGYLADRDHGLAWLHETGSAEETDYDRFYQRMDVAIMGRRTFEEIAQLEDAASFYPTTENYVFTQSDSLPQKGFIPVRGDVAEFVSGLGPDKNVWVVGGNTILAPLLDRDMVNHLIIQVAPVLLGAGIPLFTQKERLIRFRLDEVKQYGQFAELVYSRNDLKR
ncbi:dihydrofolate reductase family protein [Oscillospiraceae bacterium 44-34]